MRQCTDGSTLTQKKVVGECCGWGGGGKGRVRRPRRDQVCIRVFRLVPPLPHTPPSTTRNMGISKYPFIWRNGSTVKAFWRYLEETEATNDSYCTVWSDDVPRMLIKTASYKVDDCVGKLAICGLSKVDFQHENVKRALIRDYIPSVCVTFTQAVHASFCP